jgi:hypothetical protein
VAVGCDRRAFLGYLACAKREGGDWCLGWRDEGDDVSSRYWVTRVVGELGDVMLRF